MNNVVDYGLYDIFVLGRSGRNIASCGLKVSCFRKKFFSERVIQYWNVLLNFVKLSSSVNAFKANLCVHKSQQLKSEHYVSSVAFLGWPELLGGALGSWGVSGRGSGLVQGSLSFHHVTP